MKMAAAVTTVLLWMAVSFLASAQEPTPTPTPATRPPVGDFRVVPPSGPVGTVVTVTGDFDEEITGVRFHCIYFDTSDEGLVEAYRLPQSSRSFSFEFKIPVELSLRQRHGATRATLVGECEFLAMAGHQLLTASVPFTVTAGLPSTGAPPAEASGRRVPVAVALALVVVGAASAVLSLLGRSRG